MREFSVPALAEVPADANLTDLIRRNAAEAPETAVLARKVSGRWTDVSAAEFLAEVHAVAKGLVASGVEPGDRVALMSRTRYEWTLFDFAIWAAGGVVVPVYETSSAEQLEWILADSGATAAVVETAEHERTVESVRAALPALKNVWRIDEAGGVTAVGVLEGAGTGVGDATLDARRAALRADTVATIIYTSGTTGRPKGCELTHGNFLAELGNVVRLLDVLFKEDAHCLLFLPLAHVLGRIVEIGCIMARVRMGHCPDVRNLSAELAEFRPTFVLAVPRVFEKVYNTAKAKADADGKGRIFDMAVATAVAYSEGLDAGSISLGLKLRHKLFDRLVYGKLRAALGGRATHAISGGAPLGTRLGHFYRGIGFYVLEGYGLTETCAAHTVNPADAIRIGTVGKPLPGSAVRIAEDGEVLAKGGNVFRGYWKNAAATADAFDEDGWLRTGDIGTLDDEGYLTVTGRKKEILVTAGGKNVAPAVIEDRIRAHVLVSECMVVGDRRPFVAALITIDPETFPAWKEAHGKPADATVADLAEDPDLLEAIQEAVDEGNKAVSRAEGVRRFRILPVNFSEESGHLTPSLKLKRNLVMKDFADEVETIYRG